MGHLLLRLYQVCAAPPAIPGGRGVQAEPHVLGVRYGGHVGRPGAAGQIRKRQLFSDARRSAVCRTTLYIRRRPGELGARGCDELSPWQHDFGAISGGEYRFTLEGFNFKVGHHAAICNATMSVFRRLCGYLFNPVSNGRGSLLQPRSPSAWRVVGRLRPGAQLAGASSELTSLLRHWLVSDADMMPNHRGELEQQLPQQRIEIARAAAGVGTLGDEYGRSLKILLAVCTMVLLIACANVANLLLARSMTRRAQVSIQSALGASGTRLIRQALTESLVLALLGGIAGVFLGVAGTHLVVLLAFGPANGIVMHAGLSWPMLGFCAAVALLSGVCFGTAPAWLLARTNPIEAMRGMGRASADSQPHLRKLLVVLQVAASVSLLGEAC